MICLDGKYLNKFFISIPQERESIQKLVIGVVYGIVQVRENLMESFVFAAGMNSPGIDQGREQFIKVIVEIIRQLKITNVFLDLHFFEYRFKREISKIADRGDV